MPVAQITSNARQYKPNGKGVIFRHWTFPEFIGKVDQEDAEWGRSLMDKVDRFLGCWVPPLLLASPYYNPYINGRGQPAKQ